MNKRQNEIIKFCIVGTMSALIDFAVYNVVLFFSSYLVSVMAGFVLSWLFNYYLSSCWTFNEKPTRLNFIGLLSAHLFNLLVVRLGVIYIFVDLLNIHPRIAYIPTLMISAIVSYFLARFNFKHSF
jgi:putative flippase GtrA